MITGQQISISCHSNLRMEGLWGVSASLTVTSVCPDSDVKVQRMGCAIHEVCHAWGVPCMRCDTKFSLKPHR